VLDVVPTAIADVLILTPRRIRDGRGFFCEVYSEERFAEAGIRTRFVQDNLSVSAQAGTVRGLHFQAPPFAQDKLVRVGRGRVLDVAVDIRRSSPTYGRYVSIELSAEGRQLFVPAGFAHGFCTLEPDTEVLYKVSAPYAATHDRGLAWNDPALGIPWPVTADEAILSDRDRHHPLLAALDSPFG
jgi:dTDP-4-dehydrorhamnose 3,5-epimerase